jgi:hypothetical protein
MRSRRSRRNQCEPWDYDGDAIPDWWWPLTNIIDVVVPQATSALDLLHSLKQLAPGVFEAWAPPDPYLWIEVSGDLVYEGGYESDVYRAIFGSSYPLRNMPSSPPLDVQVWDADLVWDDEIGSFALSRSDLRSLAECGRVELVASSPLFSVEMTVESR